MNEPPSNSGAFIAKLSAWLQLAQFIGFAGTVNGMMKAFSPLKASGAIGAILVAAFTGIAVSLVGLFFLIFGLVKKDEFQPTAPRLQPDGF